jgi:predicted RNA-binding Zn-ribbon protein involved in translation (DUF1610 family)
MELWEIELEHEIEVFLENQHKSFICPTCGWKLEKGKCNHCSKDESNSHEYYFDPDFGDYYDKVEKEVEEFHEEVSNAKWEEVPDKEIGEIPSA